MGLRTSRVRSINTSGPNIHALLIVRRPSIPACGHKFFALYIACDQKLFSARVQAPLNSNSRASRTVPPQREPTDDDSFPSHPHATRSFSITGKNIRHLPLCFYVSLLKPVAFNVILYIQFKYTTEENLGSTSRSTKKCFPPLSRFLESSLITGLFPPS